MATIKSKLLDALFGDAWSGLASKLTDGQLDALRRYITSAVDCLNQQQEVLSLALVHANSEMDTSEVAHYAWAMNTIAKEADEGFRLLNIIGNEIEERERKAAA